MRIVLFIYLSLFPLLVLGQEHEWSGELTSAMDSGRYKDVIKMISGDANKGCAQCQNLLGICYENMGDMTNSITWYKKAAEKNSARALFNLGRIYDPLRSEISNVAKDIELAKKILP